MLGNGVIIEERYCDSQNANLGSNDITDKKKFGWNNLNPRMGSGISLEKAPEVTLNLKPHRMDYILIRFDS